MLTRDIEYRGPRSGEVMAFLSSRVKEMKLYGEELKARPCPCCNYDNHKNMALQINLETGLWYCFKCGRRGNWFTLTREFGCPLPKEDRYKNPVLNSIDFDIAKVFGKQERRPVTGGHHPELLEYLHDRGFTDATLDKWRITSKGPKLIRIPMYQWDFENAKWIMVNAKIRVCLEREKAKNSDWFDTTGGETQLLLGNHLLRVGPQYQKRIIIFEGQWDAMTATELGIDNCFSLPNGAKSIHCSQLLRYIPNDWEVWVCMDMDKPGEEAVEKFFAQLGPDKVKRFVLPKPFKDLNEWYMENPFLSKQEFFECLAGIDAKKNIEAFQPEGKYMKIDLSITAKRKDPICTTPWNRLNKILRIMPGQTTGFLSPSGFGKSTFCNQLAIHTASMGVKTGLISLEGTRNELMEKLGTVIQSTYVDEDQKRIIDNLHLSKLFGTDTSIAEIIEQCRCMAVDDGCKFIILDNLDYLEEITNDEKARAYKKIINLCLHTDLHAWMVWQPHKIDRNKHVNSGQQKGFSTALQDADNYLNFNRYKDFVRLELEKCRSMGTETLNPSVTLAYDKESNSFIQKNVSAKIAEETDSTWGGRLIPLAR